jgi:hypothetical protein
MQESLLKPRETDMFSYLIKVDLKRYKSNEFNANLKSITPRIRGEKECIGYRFTAIARKKRFIRLWGNGKKSASLMTSDYL